MNTTNLNPNKGDDSFILIARIHVKEGMTEEYFKIADAVDKAVEKSEDGMLFHHFDADPDDPLSFTWTEVYRNSESFMFHINNPPVQEYVAKHGELGDGFSVEIYGNVSDQVLDTIDTLGLPFSHFKTTSVGYAREQYFQKSHNLQ